MPLFRILTTVFIALALVAGGVSPGFAHEMHAVPEDSVQAPCHDMDGEPVRADADVSLTADCCDGGECRCDCLQQSPGSVLALRALLAATPHMLLAGVDLTGHVPASNPPATRPPIA